LVFSPGCMSRARGKRLRVYNDQVCAAVKSPQNELRSLRSEGAERREREHRQRLQRLVPIIIFGVIGLFIAKQEIPAVDRWISRLIDADAWDAIEACTEQARATVAEPGFARLLKRGEAERTGEGFYVSGVVFSELRSSGAERSYRFSCNVDRSGRVVTVSDANSPAQSPADSAAGHLQRDQAAGP